MGGTTSKLEATDWKLANGKLESDQDTLDGAPPTSDYQVFHLIKKGVNQREFDVTDDQDNLLYTTKQVPGTIACFDVSSGKEITFWLFALCDASYCLYCTCLECWNAHPSPPCLFGILPQIYALPFRFLSLSFIVI